MGSEKGNQRKTTYANAKHWTFGSSSAIKERPDRFRKASKAIGGSVFRPDLLVNLNPAEKSGFLLPDHFRDQEWNQWILIKGWNDLLKNHENYKPIEVNEDSSFESVLEVLKQNTKELFPDHQWRVSADDHQCDHLDYYNPIGQVEPLMMPLRWIDDIVFSDLRALILMLVKKIAVHHGVDLIYSDIVNADLFQFDTQKELRSFLSDRYEEDDRKQHAKAFENYWSYKSGKPAQLSKELRDFSKVSIKIFNNLWQSIQIKYKGHRKLIAWLKQGMALLENPAVKLNDFVFSESGDDDENPVQITKAVFFSYAVDDIVFESAESWLNDMAQSYGINDIYEHGKLTIYEHEKIVSFAPINDLLSWMQIGHSFSFTKNKLWK